jgi:acetyl-CoA carboxylase biotin carboxylase subunit
VDTHGYEDYVIPPYYDSLVAKLIVHDRTRAEAIARMSRALDFFVVEGIRTSIPLHKRILRDPDFAAGKMSTRFMERFLARAKEEAEAKAKEGKEGGGAK